MPGMRHVSPCGPSLILGGWGVEGAPRDLPAWKGCMGARGIASSGTVQRRFGGGG